MGLVFSSGHFQGTGGLAWAPATATLLSPSALRLCAPQLAWLTLLALDVAWEIGHLHPHAKQGVLDPSLYSIKATRAPRREHISQTIPWQRRARYCSLHYHGMTGNNPENVSHLWPTGQELWRKKTAQKNLSLSCPKILRCCDCIPLSFEKHRHLLRSVSCKAGAMPSGHSLPSAYSCISQHSWTSCITRNLQMLNDSFSFGPHAMQVQSWLLSQN